MQCKMIAYDFILPTSLTSQYDEKFGFAGEMRAVDAIKGIEDIVNGHQLPIWPEHMTLYAMGENRKHKCVRIFVGCAVPGFLNQFANLLKKCMTVKLYIFDTINWLYYTWGISSPGFLLVLVIPSEVLN